MKTRVPDNATVRRADTPRARSAERFVALAPCALALAAILVRGKRSRTDEERQRLLAEKSAVQRSVDRFRALATHFLRGCVVLEAGRNTSFMYCDAAEQSASRASGERAS